MQKRKNCLSVGLLVLLMAATGVLLLRDQPLSRLAGILGRIHGGFVALGLLLMLAFVGCEALCSRLVLARLGHKVPYRRCLGYSFTGFYFSSITPSATGGQPAQVYYMSKDHIPAAHGALNMMLLAVCYQVTVIVYALAVLVLRFDLLANLGTGLGLLLLFGGGVNLLLTAGMLGLMSLPNVARRLMERVLGLGVRLRLVKDAAAARTRLGGQLEEYRRGACCLRQNLSLLPALAGITVVQLTALFAVPYVVYLAFGLSGFGALDIICTQALVTLAVSSLPLPGAVGASEGGFVAAMTLFFGAGLVTPAVLVSRGVSFYSFLLVSGGVTLYMHLRSRRKDGAVPRPSLAPKGVRHAAPGL